MNDRDLRDFAEVKAEEAGRLLERWQGYSSDLLRALTALVEPYGFTPPSKDLTPEQTAVKMSEKGWWIKRLRGLQRERLNHIDRSLNYVSKANHCYVGRHSATLHRIQVLRNQEYAQSTGFVSSTGELRLLSEIVEHNLTNPYVRNAELMVRIKGFEQVSEFYGHGALFITLTTPSRFHPTLSCGAPNPKYDHSSVGEAQTWLNRNWQLIRSALHRKGIQPYGFRVVEPHHDGTPHWHLLLFSPTDQQKVIDRAIRKYMEIEPEKGSDKHRVKTEVIDPTKGSAVGYIAKYVSKNLDGKHIEDDGNGNSGAEAGRLITAWARTEKIRQFQQIGGPPVSVWRELRKLAPSGEQAGALAEARTAADAGNWAAYCIAMGGIECSRADRPLSLHRDYRERIDTSTGEILLDDTAWHGGKKAPRIMGVVSPQGVVITRTEEWRVIRKRSPEMGRDSQNPYAYGAGRAAPDLGPV